MQKYYDLQAEKQEKITQLFKDAGVFFAFDVEQFEKNKGILEPGDQWFQYNNGTYLPKSKLAFFDNGYDEIEIWFQNSLEEKGVRYAHIAYELANHEAYFSYSIDSTMDALGPEYREQEVEEVFKKELPKNLAFL
jgi:hypothetical protein